MVARKEPTNDLTMDGRVSEEVRIRKAAKQALTRRRKQLEQAVNSAANDIEVEAARDEYLVAFNKLEEAHDKLIWAKDSDSEDPVDQAYMDEPVQEKLTVLAAYKTWDETRKTTEKTARDEASTFRKTEAEREEAEKKAKEKGDYLVRLRTLLEIEVAAIGDPETDFQESVNVGISAERMQEKTKKLEAQLERLENMRRDLVAKGGKTAGRIYTQAPKV